LVESDANVYSDGVILGARRRSVASAGGGSGAPTFALRYAAGLRGMGGGVAAGALYCGGGRPYAAGYARGAACCCCGGGGGGRQNAVGDTGGGDCGGDDL